MKITSISFTPLARNRSCLSLKAGNGLAGEWVIDQKLCETAAALAEACLFGEDARATSSLWRQMTLRTRDSSGGRRAAAALDVALWDLKAKHDGEPLWRKLGGDRRRANAHVSIRKENPTLEDIHSQICQSTKAFGFRGGKISLSLDGQDNESKIQAMLSALDASAQPPTLFVNVLAPPTPKEAIHALQTLERKFDITAVQTPTAMWDVRGTRRIGDSIRGAVMNDASIYGREGFLPHFHARSINILQLSLETDGITGIVELADAAFGYELPVVIANATGNIGAHFAGVLPYLMSLEICAPQPSDDVESAVEIRDGWAVPGEAPGLGVIWPGAGEENTGDPS